MKKIEFRELKGIEIRSEDGKPSVLSGYAALFNSRSVDLGGFIEVIRPGAFTRTLKDNPEVLALAHHDTSRPLARRSAGTLAVSEDDKGLRVEITLNDSSAAQDVLADVRSRNIEGMSFGFSAVKDAVTRKVGELPLRELIDVDLFEVSPVTMPAYPETSVAARSLPQSVEDALKAPSEPTAEHSAACARLNECSLKLLSLAL